MLLLTRRRILSPDKVCTTLFYSLFPYTRLKATAELLNGPGGHEHCVQFRGRHHAVYVADEGAVCHHCAMNPWIGLAGKDQPVRSFFAREWKDGIVGQIWRSLGKWDSRVTLPRRNRNLNSEGSGHWFGTQLLFCQLLIQRSRMNFEC